MIVSDMKKSYLPLAVAAAVAAAGCSSISLPESKKIDYKSATKAATSSLEVPPDLTAPSADERFAVPDIGVRGGSATYSGYANDRSPQAGAQSSLVLPTVDKVRIERAGSQRWLVVNGDPAKLWPVIKEFWQDLGFIVNVELPEAGVMETDWAEDRAKIADDGIRSIIGKALDAFYSTGERDKFRTRIEPGAQGTTEIYISHRGMEEVYTSSAKDDTRWQPRPPNPELEAEMLRRLMVRFGTEEQKAASMVAAAKAQQDRAKLSWSADVGGTLDVAERFDRAWRRVGLSLDRVGFTVEDRDRSKGIYYVRYVDPEADNQKKDDKGFMSKLAFWRSDDKSDKASANGQYRIHIKDDGEHSVVQVLSREGGADKSETSRKILNLLYEQLK
jgi:outer membrane protein assembly factor BamC